MLRTYLSFALCLISPALLWPQSPSTQVQRKERIPAAEAITDALKNNALVDDGKPFHAQLDIHEDKGDPDYGGHIELFWVSATKYRLFVSSKDFEQTLIVNGARTQEKDRGDFYPSWLHGFVTALINPLPRKAELEDSNQTVDPETTGVSCLSREDRPNGITDQLTWVTSCFARGVRLDSVRDFTYNMDFKDFKSFDDKQVATTYLSSPSDRVKLIGKLSTLEQLPKVDDRLFHISHPTPPKKQIHTIFVSTLKEESMVASKPEDIDWPPAYSSKLDGYMIVHAITDRTGQVREAWSFSFDDPNVASSGRVLALKYKFHPLVVGGVAQQIEMPLVIHFSTIPVEYYPAFADRQTRQRVSCALPTSVSDPKYAGQFVLIRIYFDVDGGVLYAGVNGIFSTSLASQLRTMHCHFKAAPEDVVSRHYVGYIRVQATP